MLNLYKESQTIRVKLFLRRSKLRANKIWYQRGASRASATDHTSDLVKRSSRGDVSFLHIARVKDELLEEERSVACHMFTEYSSQFMNIAFRLAAHDNSWKFHETRPFFE